MPEWFIYLITMIAAMAAGAVNALAGGGTLITFPVLISLGVPAIIANVTNTVALCPGYIGATWSQRKDLSGKFRELLILIPVSLAGGIAGGYLLLVSGEKLFREFMPYLILFASLLLALQNRIKEIFLKPDRSQKPAKVFNVISIFLLFPTAVYGGYFGAGVSVIILAVLGLGSSDSITRLNAMKQAIAFSINISAAVYFVFSGKVNWTFAGFMAVGALTGGVLGGRLAGKVKPEVLRWIVIIIGVMVGLIYLLS